MLFLLVEYGYIILKEKRIPKEMTAIEIQHNGLSAPPEVASRGSPGKGYPYTALPRPRASLRAACRYPMVWFYIWPTVRILLGTIESVSRRTQWSGRSWKNTKQIRTYTGKTHPWNRDFVGPCLKLWGASQVLVGSKPPNLLADCSAADENTWPTATSGGWTLTT